MQGLQRQMDCVLLPKAGAEKQVLEAAGQRILREDMWDLQGINN
jgi:hypothetical protein